MHVFPLPEGTFTVDKTKLFVPFDHEADDLQQRPTGSLLVKIRPFAIQTSNDILLLDTGLGFEKEGELQLHQNLKQAGIQPHQITKVLLTHLHKDHSGGVGWKGRLSFSNAVYYVQENELKYAFEKGFPSYLTGDLECLRNNSQVVLIDGDGLIDNYIEYQVTGAHSKYHQVFWIREDNKTIFFGGDDAPQLQQMKHRFIAKYDYNGKKAMELRKQWWDQGQKEGWEFLFYHDHN